MGNRVTRLLFILIVVLVVYGVMVFNSFFSLEYACVYDPCSDTMYEIELDPSVSEYFKEEWYNPLSQKTYFDVSEVLAVYDYSDRQDEIRHRREEMMVRIVDGSARQAYSDSVSSRLETAFTSIGDTSQVASIFEMLLSSQKAMLFSFPSGDYDCDISTVIPDEMKSLIESEEWDEMDVGAVGFVFAQKGAKTRLQTKVHNRVLLIRGEAFWEGRRMGLW